MNRSEAHVTQFIEQVKIRALLRCLHVDRDVEMKMEREEDLFASQHVHREINIFNLSLFNQLHDFVGGLLLTVKREKGGEDVETDKTRPLTNPFLNILSSLCPLHSFE